MKRTLSLLLALALLLPIIPMTAASAAEPDDELAATGVSYGVSTGDSLLYILSKDNGSDGDVVTVNVTADISCYLTTQGDSSDNSYLRYACVVGKGKKVLNLNGHKLHFYNDYSVLVDHSMDGENEMNKRNRQSLFKIQSGTKLYVNGNDADGNEGLIQYHGKLLNKCDAVDQRDIFEITGGSLTVNSGRYLAGGEVTSYKFSDYKYKLWYLVGGTAIRALSGRLTVNGGRFEGRGLSGYTYTRNAALYAESGMDAVTINDGEFYGASHGDVLNLSTLMQSRFTVRCGKFVSDQNDAYISAVYHSYKYCTYAPGRQGFVYTNPDDCSLYVYQPTAGSAVKLIDPDDLRGNKTPFTLTSTCPTILVQPRTGKASSSGLPYLPTSEVEFYFDGKQYNTSDDITWDKNSSLKLDIDYKSLYFPYIGTLNRDVTHSLTAVAEILHYISDGNQPTILTNVPVKVTANSDGTFRCDLNSISSSAKAALTAGEMYCFKFTFTENWQSCSSGSILHRGWFYVEIASGGSSSKYWIGDVNNDGAVKNRDALILDRYIAGWKDYDQQIKNRDAADMNRDGQIKNRDALMLDRYIAGWKDYQKYVIQV